MLVNLQINKNTISSWVLALFTFSLIIGGLASEFFQAPVTTTKELEKYRQLLTTEQLDTFNILQFKNNLGQFNLEKSDHWLLTAPRRIDANIKTIEVIKNAIGSLKIRKIYPKDTINMSNFQLESPSLSLTLQNKTEKKTIHFGLINSIDNSTYLTLEGLDAIYHVDNILPKLERLSLPDFVDSRIFTMNIADIQSFKIFRQNEQSKSRLEILRDEDATWSGPKGKLNSGTVETYLQELLTTKSNYILDSRTQEQQEKIDQYLSKPLYRIIVETKENKSITYDVSYIFTTLPDIKLEKKQNFIIRASNRQHPFIVHKNALELFSKRQRNFPPLTIKKLFY